jgi:hypothetical protein
MDTVLRHLDIIKDEERRLHDLARHRGTPDNMVDEYLNRANTFEWAYSFLREKLTLDILLIVGDFDYLKFLMPDREISIDDQTRLGYVIILDCTEIDFGVSCEGNDIPQNIVPYYISCKKCYAFCDRGDKDRRVVWIKGQVLRKEFEIGSIARWLCDFFGRLKWAQAKETGDA